MIKLLVKKQMTEIFRAYFYDAKKNKKRSALGTALFFLLYLVIMVGVLGGMFGALAMELCEPMAVAKVSWLYFLIMGLIAIALGTFGSVFNTFTSLYLSKDNDLLLSMPIPVVNIMIARLVSVFLLGLMYSATVSLPTVIVYWLKVGPSLGSVLGGLNYILMIAVFDLVLSCVLGWVVARLSLKLKNKSFVTVFISLVFIGLYYFVYFQAQQMISDIVINASLYGAKLQGTSLLLYSFGRMGLGHVGSNLGVSAIVMAMAAIVCYVINRSFIVIATSQATVTKVKYQAKKVKQKGLFAAIFGKELARFTASSTYMLNCGLGTVFLPVMGVGLLVKSQTISASINRMFEGDQDIVFLILCTMMCVAAAMNDMTAPSISLEGKNIWIAQSLPVPAKLFLQAKIALQLLITAIPLVFTAVCAAIVVDGTVLQRIILIILPLLMEVFFACFGLVLGLLFPNLKWTNEISPIKQSLSVFIAIFGGWVLAAGMLAGYLLTNWSLGVESYVAIYGGVIVIGVILSYMWIVTKGVKRYEQL